MDTTQAIKEFQKNGIKFMEQTSIPRIPRIDFTCAIEAMPGGYMVAILDSEGYAQKERYIVTSRAAVYETLAVRLKKVTDGLPETSK